MSLLDEVECYGFTCYVVDCDVDAPERWSRAEAMQDEREHRAWHEQHPGLVFVDGHAPQPAAPSPVHCTHDGGEWPGLDRCADCGQMLDPAGLSSGGVS